MNNPSLLLVYRIAKDGDEFAARCVCCDVNSPESWNRQMQWSGTSLNTGEQIKFRLSVSDFSGGPDGPPEVYGEEECMKIISKDNWIPVRVSQNGTFLRIEDIGGNEDCPFFLSLEVPTMPVVFEANIQIEIGGVHRLPEVAEYEERMSESAVDKWDALAHSPLAEAIPFPIGCKFPATMASGLRECGVVYELLSEPQENGVAQVRVYSSDRSIELEGGAKLVRRFRNSRGSVAEVEIGHLAPNAATSFA